MPERRLRRPAVVGAALAALLPAAYFLSPASGGDRAGDDLLATPAPRRAAATAQPPAEAPAPDAPQAAPPASAEGLRLHGITASGAIVGFQGGVQRLILLGRDVLPGLRLQELRQHDVLLASSAGAIELGFSGPAQSRPAGGEARTDAAPESDAAEAAREETLHYRFGLAARRSDGRITGFAIRPEADLPLLRRAGLQAGDVLISVNGQSFDSQERVQELASEIAGSFTAEFEFERGGRRMRRSLEVNPRE